MSGMVTGGMEYVTAAYGVTWCALLGYMVSLYWRSRASRS